MKADFGKSKVMVSDGITKDGLYRSNVDQCGVCSLRLKANSVLCVQCNKWVHGRCAGLKNVILLAENMKGIFTFTQRLKGVVYKSYVRPLFLYGSQA